MPSRAHTLVLAAAFASLLSACGDDSAGLLPATVLRPAAVAFYGDTAQITVPDSARVGVPFLVLVQSFGDGCTAMDLTGVAVTSNRVDVRPLVREPSPTSQTVCATILRSFTHSASVTITQAGTATVVVHGRGEPGTTSVRFTRTVRVVP